MRFLVIPSREDPPDSTNHLRNYWGFANPRFVNDKNQYTDEKIKQTLIFLTRRYAWMWKLTVEEFRKMMQKSRKLGFTG